MSSPDPGSSAGGYEDQGSHAPLAAQIQPSQQGLVTGEMLASLQANKGRQWNNEVGNSTVTQTCLLTESSGPLEVVSTKGKKAQHLQYVKMMIKH